MSTTDLTKEQASAWLEAARNAGWDVQALYNHEPKEQAAKITRNGWVGHILNRPNGGRRYANVTIWSKEGLQLDGPPVVYDDKVLLDLVNVCSYCKQVVAEIVRIRFAGRCCKPCREKHVAEVEYPGWTN